MRQYYIDFLDINPIYSDSIPYNRPYFRIRILVSVSLKSQSCPSSLISTSESIIKSTDQVINEQTIPISSSLETLLSSVSTRGCICYERHLAKSMSCTRCLSTRTDLGYSSEQDDTCSFGPCECSLTPCDTCLTELSHCCPLHEEDESGTSVSPCDSILSSSDYILRDISIDCTKTIELCDTTRKHKIKLQLSHEYPFFNMHLKQIWDENPLSNIDNEIYISDDDLYEFSMLNKNVDRKRAQLREIFKFKFQSWKQRLPYKM
ncbi:unnamed protein product [Adineta steineri]|uniref:Uncharacterized protein n=1 Tax=Adineta steineri TaxID=433720 RepID=A0A814QXJ5_9BILA|nr:unnamed protein product [Adineta steineri]